MSAYMYKQGKPFYIQEIIVPVSKPLLTTFHRILTDYSVYILIKFTIIKLILHPSVSCCHTKGFT